MGNHSEALPFYEKTVPPYHVRLATVYNSIAFAYYHMKEYPNALLYLERALNIVRLLPANHRHLENLRLDIETVKKDMNC
jgi:tetratricopeptide (TPR) repeat protein